MFCKSVSWLSSIAAELIGEQANIENCQRLKLHGHLPQHLCSFTFRVSPIWSNAQGIVRGKRIFARTYMRLMPVARHRSRLVRVMLPDICLSSTRVDVQLQSQRPRWKTFDAIDAANLSFALVQSPRGWDMITFWLVDRDEIVFWLVGVLRGWEDSTPNQNAPDRDERGLSIGRKLKYTYLIGWANVDRIGRFGPRVEVFRTYHYHNHSYEYLRVTSFKVLCILLCLL